MEKLLLAIATRSLQCALIVFPGLSVGQLTPIGDNDSGDLVEIPMNPDGTAKANRLGYTPGTFSILTDQDFFYVTPASRNEDRNYTQGTAFVYSNPSLLNSPFYWPFRQIEKYMDKNSEAPVDRTNASFGLGGTAFTPRIIDSINPVVGDRPFAFLFYTSLSSTFMKTKTFRRQKKDPKSVNIYHTFTTNVGLFGTNLGYQFQSFAHTHLVKGRPTDPKGWNTQISQGGAPTILLEYSRFRPLFHLGTFKRAEDRCVIDVGWNFGGSVGYYDRVFNDLYVRIGLLNKSNQARWNGAFAAINNASYKRTDNSKKMDRFELFGFARLKHTLMLRNSMLLGQRWFGNSGEYTLDKSWVKISVFDVEWGAVLAVNYTVDSEPRSFAIFARQVYRSPEFDSKLFPVRSHFFGSLGLLFPVR